jgi:hypothetical protein
VTRPLDIPKCLSCNGILVVAKTQRPVREGTWYVKSTAWSVGPSVSGDGVGGAQVMHCRHRAVLSDVGQPHLVRPLGGEVTTDPVLVGPAGRACRSCRGASCPSCSTKRSVSRSATRSARTSPPRPRGLRRPADHGSASRPPRTRLRGGHLGGRRGCGARDGLLYRRRVHRELQREGPSPPMSQPGSPRTSR